MPSVPPMNSPPRIICIEMKNPLRSSSLIAHPTSATCIGEGRKTSRIPVNDANPHHTRMAIVGRTRVLKVRGRSRRILDAGIAGGVRATFRWSIDLTESRIP